MREAQWHSLPLPDGRPVAQALHEVLRLLHRLIGAHMREDDSEFVASDARQNVGLADLARYEIGEMAEHGIARGVSMGVIDRFEVVEVEINDDRGRSVAFGEADESGDLADESAPIEDWQQHVLICRPCKVF